MRLKTKVKIGTFIFFMILMYIANTPVKKIPTEPFPAPDPNMGRAWGYDFKKKEYRYESKTSKSYPSPRANASNNKRNLRINRLSDIKDLDDLEDLINSTKQNGHEDMDEDEAADILDLTNY